MLSSQTDLLSLMAARHCKRAFLDRPVPRETLETIFRAAANAPSTKNIQPWRVIVLTGASRDALSRKLCDSFDRGTPAKLDYVSRPAQLDSQAEARGRAAEAGLLKIKGISPDDKQARRAHVRENFLFHGAPVELIFHLSAGAPAGTFLEMGFFIQNVMLGLVSYGLASCPQGTVAGYADVIREHLGLGPDRLIVCGMAVGYADESAPANRFVPERASVEEFVRWHEHEGP